MRVFNYSFFSVAPIMCQRFAQNCLSAEGDSYRGSVIYQVMNPKAFMRNPFNFLN